MNTYHLKQKWDKGEFWGNLTAEEIDHLFAEIERLEKGMAATEKAYQTEKNRPLVIHKGKPYAVVGEQPSVKNGTLEYVLRGNDGPVVVLASDCYK